MRWPIPTALLVSLALAATGCKSAYYGTLEQFGKHKRDLLVERVEDARDDQQEAKESFQSALERFSALTGFEGGELQKAYATLSDEYERCSDEAQDVEERIRSVEEVAGDLFDEWEEELGQYSDAKLRRASEDQLKATRGRYQELIGAMRRAESKMQPVLGAFRDRVLFLKHNLNAQAIASLKGEVGTLEQDVARLIREMDAAIVEANEFIESMPQS